MLVTIPPRLGTLDHKATQAYDLSTSYQSHYKHERIERAWQKLDKYYKLYNLATSLQVSLYALHTIQTGGLFD